jgi:hypothetical protein
MPKAVLTTFHRSSYRIKKINRVLYRDHHTFINIPKTIQLTSKEATIYDRGSMDVDLALIHVKIPGAFPLPLAEEVHVGEKIFTLGHPKGIQFTPSPIGTIERIYMRKGTKHMQLSIQGISGMSGSPVLNMKGEVVGIIRARLEGLGLGAGEAVHVEELRKILGLTIYNFSPTKYSPAIETWSGAVYSTGYSRLFHQPDCNELIANDGDLITFLSREAAMKNGGKPCPECGP